MAQSMASFLVAGTLLFTSACAQFVHPGERLGSSGIPVNAGYAESPSFWYGSGSWWNPFGYYGSGYGWYGGSSSGASQPSSGAAPRPTPPANAPPQFQKKH